MSISSTPGSEHFQMRAAEHDSDYWKESANRARAEYETAVAELARQVGIEEGYRVRQTSLLDEGNALTAERRAFEGVAARDVIENPCCAVADLSDALQRLRSREELLSRSLQKLCEEVFPIQRLKVLQSNADSLAAAASLAESKVLLSAARTRESLAAAEDEEGEILMFVGSRTAGFIEDHYHAVEASGKARQAVELEVARQAEATRARVSKGVITASNWRI